MKYWFNVGDSKEQFLVGILSVNVDKEADSVTIKTDSGKTETMSSKEFLCVADEIRNYVYMETTTEQERKNAKDTAEAYKNWI